jgi:type IV secretory pathway VirB2 component (pilin)
MKKSLFVFIFLALIIPSVVSAVSPYDCGGLLASGLESTAQLCTVLYDIRWILAAAAFSLAIIMVIIGGIKYMTAGDDAEKTKSGRKTIINGLIGAAIVFAASFIVNLVGDFVLNRIVGGP